MICVMCKHGRTSPGTATMMFDELVDEAAKAGVRVEVREYVAETLTGR